jgi:Flp pilus assembly protein TadG
VFHQRLIRSTCAFSRCAQGNTAIIFALALLPILGAVGAGVDYSQANSMKSSMQAATDATALALVSQAGTLTSDQLSSAATNYFTVNFNRTASNVAVSSSYSSQTGILTVNASATSATTFLNVMGISSVPVSTSSQASLGTKTYQVCVMITNPSEGHTLLTQDTAHFDFTNCMVQVNTDDWDAVQADSSSYMHGHNSDNCFVGQIHFGDISPPRDPSCKFFPDPFAGYTLPGSASTCNYTALKVTTNNTVLNPGTYCNGLEIQGVTNVMFNPGLYIVSDNVFKINGPNSPTNVTGNGVTFVMTGKNAGFDFNSANLNITPAMNVGQYSGFLFFLDQTGAAGGSPPYANTSKFHTVAMNSNGIIYLVGQIFEMQNGTNVTLNTGSIIADELHPKNDAVLNLTGQLNSGSSAQIALQKASSGSSNRPVLVH